MMGIPRNYGPLSREFLSKSVASILRNEPLVVKETTPVRDVLAILKKEKAGGVLITNAHGALTGIFTERDCVLKVVESYCIGASDEPVSRFMTPNPSTVAPDEPIAYALNLMSHGGFRHLPVAAEGEILGLLTVKDIVDEIVRGLVVELEGFSDL